MSGFPTDILSARVARYPVLTDGWVWLIVVPFSFQDCGGFQIVEPSPASFGRATDGPCQLKSTTEMIVIDYQTGEFLEDRIPAD